MNLNTLLWSAAGTFLGFLGIRFLDELLGLEAAARSLAEWLRTTFNIPQYAEMMAPDAP